MKVFEIPFGEWLPDHPDYKNPGCLTADNCFPVPGGYGPFPGLDPSDDGQFSFGGDYDKSDYSAGDYN